MTVPPPPFPPSVHADRRRRIFDRLGSGALVLPAAPLVHRSRDTEYPYRPDSELQWATGFEEPEALAVLRGHADEDRFVLFVRERDPEAELWAGPRLGSEAAKERLGADAVHPVAELEERLPGLLDGADAAYFRLGAGRAGEAQVLEALRRSRSRGPRRGTGPRAVVDPGEVLDELRLRKGPEEIARIRAAAEITVEALREVAPMMRAGTGEWEVQGRLDGAFRARGGEGPAYGSIVGSGPNACVLHYVANGRRMGSGELVLVDAGASVGWYAADLTRTLPVGGRFQGPGRAVYEVVERARAAAVAAVAPGATVDDVHRAAVEVMVTGLVELGVVEAGRRGDPDAHRPWFPHQTSHWLGLDVHDVGDYAREGHSRVLEPGMVLTVEPGLYFGATAVAGANGAADAFAGVGVRIEDDVVVTPTGREVLTAGCPTDPGEVAALVLD